MIETIPDRLERTLRQTLAPGERVFIKLRGAYTEALICTDTRVLILKGGWMAGQLFGTDTFQCPYANIAGAEVKFHLLTGYFELSAGGMQNTPKSFWRTDNKVRAANAPNCVSIGGPDQARKFRQACAFIMARTKGGSHTQRVTTPSPRWATRRPEGFGRPVRSGISGHEGTVAVVEALTSGRFAKGHLAWLTCWS